MAGVKNTAGNRISVSAGVPRLPAFPAGGGWPGGRAPPHPLTPAGLPALRREVRPRARPRATPAPAAAGTRGDTP